MSNTFIRIVVFVLQFVNFIAIIMAPSAPYFQLVSLAQPFFVIYESSQKYKIILQINLNFYL